MEKNTKVILIFFIVVVILVAVMYFSVSRIGNKEEKEVVEVGKGFFPALGEGEIEIIEFSDFACPVCKIQEPIIKEVIEKYGNEISFYYRLFPLPMHKNSFEVALSASCADEQEKFWEYHDLLFENQGSFDEESLKSYALQIGLNEEQFNNCLDEEKYKKQVNKDIDEGIIAGVQGTPTFFVNNKKYGGFKDFQFFKNLIEQAR